MIEVEDRDTGYTTLVAVDFITTVQKGKGDYDITIIGLKDGRVIYTPDSIKTIQARIELAGKGD